MATKSKAIRTTIFSERLLRSQCALRGLTLRELNDQVFKPGNNFIYTLLNKERINVKTINRIARVLECSVCDMLEEIDLPAEKVKQNRRSVQSAGLSLV